MKVKIISRVWMNDTEFYFYDDRSRPISVAEPVQLKFKLHDPGAMIGPGSSTAPTFVLNYAQSIEFVDSVIEEARLSYLGDAQKYHKENVFEAEEIKILKEELASWKKLAMTLLGAA